MEEYLKIYTQDGLVYFSPFRISDVLLTRISESEVRFDLDIKTFDGPYSEDELNKLKNRFNEAINNDYGYAWLTIENKRLMCKSLDGIETIEFEIRKGWDEGSGEGLAGIYFGWRVELLENKIRIEIDKATNTGTITWTAVSGDTNYYDERAKATKYEFRAKVRVLYFMDAQEIRERWRRLANMTDRYYEIIRNMKGHPMEGRDIKVIDKLNEEYGYKHSIEAWGLVPQIIKQYPKPSKY